VRSFRGDHPGVLFNLTQVHELHGLPLNGGTADLEIGTRRFRTGGEATRPGDLAVWTRQIGVEPLRLALPRDHRLAARRKIRLADVAAEPFIALRPTSALRKLGDDLCKQAGFRPAVVFEGDDLSNVRGLVAAGLGVAIVPAPRAGSPEAAPGPVAYPEITDDGAERAIYLTWPASRLLLPAPDLFREHVIRTVSTGQARPVGT
jgi:DNA-binding transcriptional LysR family regulator